MGFDLKRANKFGLGAVLILVMGVSACGIRDTLSNITSGSPNVRVGLPFDARLTTGESFRDFTVSVRAAGATLIEARESARYPATAHCLDSTGSSEIVWEIDPETGDWAVSRTEDGDLIVQGRCAER